MFVQMSLILMTRRPIWDLTAILFKVVTPEVLMEVVVTRIVTAVH